jgi:tripeptidyl-peptidase-2
LEASLHREESSTSSSSDGANNEERKAKLALWKQYEKEYEDLDLGPIYDCICFHDGERWQAAIDSFETGDFSAVDCMTDYRHSRQFARFSSVDNFNYAVNIFDDGNILSIVTGGLYKLFQRCCILLSAVKGRGV